MTNTRGEVIISGGWKLFQYAKKVGSANHLKCQRVLINKRGGFNNFLSGDDARFPQKRNYPLVYYSSRSRLK